jgi:polyphosphate kinase
MGKTLTSGRRQTSANLPSDAGLFVNRELSLLRFQGRVLEEAMDPRVPLLDRVKFHAILGSNLNEFFMVRVSGLMKQVEAGLAEVADGEMSPAELLSAVRERVFDLMEESRRSLQEELLPELGRAGLKVLDYAQLSATQRREVNKYFREIIFPILTPLAFDPGRPFPHISNLSLNLAITIEDEAGNKRFARLKIPSSVPQFVPIEGDTKRNTAALKEGPRSSYVWLEQVIAANLKDLFPGMKVLEVHPFHVTRDADLEIQELDASDLPASVEQSVRQRRFGNVIRLAVSVDMPDHLLQTLVSNLEITQNEVYRLHGPLALARLMGIYGVDRPDLKETIFVPRIPEALVPKTEDEDIFAAIRRGDIFLHHPFDSFQPVIQLLKQAARDPDVLAIKMTLYRVGRNSPVVEALLEAMEQGKQVSVLLELKARFDEESNIGWARALERQGVHVVYGLLGYKVHSKVAMVVRREGKVMRRYLHLGTGNYNAVTAHLYTDMGLLTCDPELGADATDLFNFLTGYSAKDDYRKLLIAPLDLRQRFMEMVEREIAHQKAGRPAGLILKANGLVDREIIRQLYRASQEGLQIDLLIRGICCLRPGIPGVSENIRVTSIVGRFLEHSRVFYFENGGDHQIYLGSADLMPRNLNERVETVFPITNEQMVEQIRSILELYLADNSKARRMQSDGIYVSRKPDKKESSVEAQSELLRTAQLGPGVAG